MSQLGAKFKNGCKWGKLFAGGKVKHLAVSGLKFNFHVVFSETINC